MTSFSFLLVLVGTLCASIMAEDGYSKSRRALSDNDMKKLTKEYNIADEESLKVKVASTWVSKQNIGIDPEASAYFLVLNNVCSSWTKFNRDRLMLWHGGRAFVDIIDEKGDLVTKCLGDSLKYKGCRYLVVVPANHKSDIMPVGHLYFSDIVVKGTAPSSGVEIAYNDMMKDYPKHATTIKNTKKCYKKST